MTMARCSVRHKARKKRIKRLHQWRQHQLMTYHAGWITSLDWSAFATAISEAMQRWREVLHRAVEWFQNACLEMGMAVAKWSNRLHEDNLVSCPDPSAIDHVTLTD